VNLTGEQLGRDVPEALADLAVGEGGGSPR
jgi:hypothetical protein